jgi:copper chaperone CopZ
MKRVELSLAGLCCYSCATTVEKEVARLKGVRNAFADWKKKVMTVEFDEKLTDKKAIEAKMAEVVKRFETV